MAAIDDLIQQIEDPELRRRIKQEADKLTKSKKFGLVFEDHIPECTPLYDMPIKRGSLVARKVGNISDLYEVDSIDNDIAVCYKKSNSQKEEISLDELVCVARFGDPIYPYLKPIDQVCNAPDSDLWHTLIEADNYHALQLLEYLYAGKVDCIYIDPPYNKVNSRDWKYNCNYVDGNDSYRHSKWLSMIEKRLRISKKLLNPKSSILIVTIDDDEYVHLGCLLEELFPEAKITMISSVINPSGKAKKGGVDFSRTDEFIYFLQIGDMPVLPEKREIKETPIAWETFRRHSLANGRGKHGVGACGPNQFYPIYVNNKTKKIEKIGYPIKEDVPRESVNDIEGCTTVFPVRDNGIEMNWGSVREEAIKRLNMGYLRVGKHMPNKPQQYSIQYLTSGTINAINEGKVIITGKSEDGSVNGFYPEGKPKVPTTNWNKPSHNATSYGTDMITSILCTNAFDYPKSLYAVRDCLKMFLKHKKHALILDYFAGSGTTMHAVNLLNLEDNGNRRCILVTNNEISESEEKKLLQKGIGPGDTEWEDLGIAHSVTWPRTKCSILGENINGQKLKGKYLDSSNNMKDGFKTNAAFLKLSFLDRTSIALGRQLKELIPVLWMKSNCKGICPDNVDVTNDILLFPENKFAILVNENKFNEFHDKIIENDIYEYLYFITDSAIGYREMISDFREKNTFQLYRDYLDNFRINTVR